MNKQRFSLLLLEPGEIYFEDFSCILVETESLSQHGRLKLCSKSLVFDPREISAPITKIAFKDCILINDCSSESLLKTSENMLSVKCEKYAELLSGNILAPYVFKGSRHFQFILNYAKVENCLTHISQLQRAATLSTAEQNAMIATIVHSRHSRCKFDPLWMSCIHERILINTRADKVSSLVVNPGRVVLSTQRFYFQPYNNVEPYFILKVNLEDIKKVIPRRFLLRHVGLEIHYNSCTSDGGYIYIAFRSSNDRDELRNTMLSQPNVTLDELEQDVMTLQWQNGILSNYDYLLYLNSLGDRTNIDLTQYPIFPWILTDYSSESIDLSDETIYRDLTKPVGALNPERFLKLKERYEEMSMPKFIYGSHYSAPGLVLFYLVRKYPHYMLCLQNGRFDHPDRMFNSVLGVFRNCMNNMSDFKELIPEFYDVDQKGGFLVNSNNINFGYQSDGTKVGDVKLPKWAKDPEHFVRVLRDALESEYVSRNLNHWIDLIFGYKQQGPEAMKSHNLFYYLCYEGAINLDLIKDVNERHALEVQIMEFGQIPKQVFTVPHPQRRQSRIPLPMSSGIESNECTNTHRKTIIGLSLKSSLSGHKSKIASVIIREDNDTIISVGHDSFLKMYSISQNKVLRNYKVGNKVLSSCVSLENENIVIIGCWDDTIIFYDTQFGRISTSMRIHEDAVSVIAWSGDSSRILASGSWDCRVHVWMGCHEMQEMKKRKRPKFAAEMDHDSQISCLAFSPDSSLLATGTIDGELYLWTTTNFSRSIILQRHNAQVTAVSFSSDSQKFISCGEDGVFRIVDLKTRMVLFQKQVAEKILCLVWDGAFLILGTDCDIIYLWDMLEVKLISTISAHNGPVVSLAMSNDAEFLVTTGHDQTIKIWKCEKK